MNKPVPPWVDAFVRHRGLIVPIAFISLVGVIIVPLHPAVMDVMIAANISIAAIMLLTTIYLNSPLEFNVFPSLLLGTTLFRLVLNIATTRLILTADATNAEEAAGVAGKVIQAFGDFVAGDNPVVGVVIFAILIIVQFVVITKGATRISEVAARFTLDAMPGKQMAIDADLNAGVIDEAEARSRRDDIMHEADFYGAMDGASKFVRGDAIASVLITAINILGGLFVGMIGRGWSVGETVNVFTKLTIGDGLVSQVPAFLIAIASGLIITRSGAKDSLGNELTGQLFNRPVALVLTACFLIGMAFTPLPAIPLIAMSMVLLSIALFTTRSRNARTATREQRAREQAISIDTQPAVETLLKVDQLELEVGYAVVSLVDASQGGDLLDRIAMIRRQVAVEMGFVMPPVRIRDNMQLDPNAYRVKLRGAVVDEGTTYPGKLLAMDSGLAEGPLDGIKTKEPAFGLDAWWIETALKQRAENMNYTVVDASSVLATHLTEIVKRHADEMLSREEVHNLLQGVAEKSPKVVAEVVPDLIKPAELQKVLQNLLRERVPIRDLEIILETLGDWAPKSKDIDVLTEYVRHSLRRTICGQHLVMDDAGNQRLVCVTLDPSLEDFISGYVDRSAGGTVMTMPPQLARDVASAIVESLQAVVAAGHEPIILASPQVRGPVRELVEPHLSTVGVLGYNEIVSGVRIESMGLVRLPEPQTSGASAA
ncbi:MAG: flagellar biosynthesis protein FlhA [Phycisphaerales bacterium]|nr:flagellar biosynthesis protein FlhA [Phycisphaerales bacterium]